MNPPPANLLDFATQALGVRPTRWERMAGGGSDREFHRLWAGEASYVAALCADRAECRAFVGWTPHFRARGIPVPQLFGERLAEGLYLMEDLGPETLCDRLVAL
ncbi:MAG: phosphotransferase, partial [SAR324 cluster bacterium]|nr:phosphotransferase [SAR324 cluster bacterium]